MPSQLKCPHVNIKSTIWHPTGTNLENGY